MKWTIALMVLRLAVRVLSERISDDDLKRLSLHDLTVRETFDEIVRRVKEEKKGGKTV